MKKKSGIPVIDLFAGPGGLCEGFASLVSGGSREFDIRVSIEKDPIAHRTLSLRALFRSFPVGRVSAPTFDEKKRVLGSITLVGHKERFQAFQEKYLCNLVTQAAAEITARIAQQEPEQQVNVLLKAA